MDSTGSFIMPSPSSSVAGEVDALFNFILWGGVVFLAIVVFTIALFSIKYRRRGRVGLTSGKDNSLSLEITWTVIPTILILVVFFWGFKSYMRMNIVPADAIEIKVTGQKWFWSFDYPGGANAVNELVVPVNKPIKLLMSSVDVIHSFFVPNFRVKMDVLPNRYTVTWFKALYTGEYDLYCTEFCGTGHSDMLGKVIVVSDSAYAAWLDASSTMGEGLTPVEFGAQLYQRKACVTCHTLDGSRKDGPSFLNRFGTQALMSDGSRVLVDENYLRESILDPRTKVANGYQAIMPTFQGILKPQQVDALIAFIKSINNVEEE